MKGMWVGYDVGCTMGLTCGHGAWQIDRQSSGSMWNSYSFQPVGQWMSYSFTDLGAEGCCRSLNALFYQGSQGCNLPTFLDNSWIWWLMDFMANGSNKSFINQLEANKISGFFFGFFNEYLVEIPGLYDDGITCLVQSSCLLGYTVVLVSALVCLGHHVQSSVLHQIFELTYPPPWTKWPPFCRWHVEMYFHPWKKLILIQISLKFVPKGPIDNNQALV